MNLFHKVVGLAVAGLFALLALWGGLLWILNAHPGKWFWRLLAAGQILFGIQIVAGAFMLISRGGRPILHYVYGAFPLLVLYYAHRIAKRLEGIEWVGFAIAGLVIFGLQLRGYMTGGS
ncbi:MAG TPA: hypothetical protein VHJ40_07935 [Actinomycetota bacterium]|nr:hypothetical protein [Actinomycetota bacterium]